MLLDRLNDFKLSQKSMPNIASKVLFCIVFMYSYNALGGLKIFTRKVYSL